MLCVILSALLELVADLDGRVRAVMGASGGPRIISSVLTTAFRWAMTSLPHP